MLPWMNYNDSLDGVLLDDVSWAHVHVWMKTVVTRPIPIACQTLLTLGVWVNVHTSWFMSVSVCYNIFCNTTEEIGQKGVHCYTGLMSNLTIPKTLLCLSDTQRVNQLKELDIRKSTTQPSPAITGTADPCMCMSVTHTSERVQCAEGFHFRQEIPNNGQTELMQCRVSEKWTSGGKI